MRIALGATCALLVSLLISCSSDASPADAGDGVPEAGNKDTAAPDTATSEKRPIGAACAKDSQCEGGTCLKEFQILDRVSYVMKNGYCSTACSWTGKDYVCDEGLECQFSKTAQHCFKKCTAPTDCRQNDGYTCVTGDICFPKDTN